MGAADFVLDILTVGQLKAIQHLPPQKSISVRIPEVEDLSPLLLHRESITYLGLDSYGSKEALRAVGKLSKLLAINIGSAHDVDFLSCLSNLSTIYLSGVSQIADFSVLRCLSGLQNLDLSDATQLTNWDLLPPLENISVLGLSGAPLVTSVREIVERAPKLKVLRLRDYVQLTDLEALAQLSLDRLVLWGTRELDDISSLSKCVSLISLDLDGTQVHDLRPLASLKRLQFLDLRNCRQVKDLSPLGHLSELRDLWLTNAASGLDLAPLAGNSQLRVHIMAGQEIHNGHLLGRRLKRISV